MTHMACISSSVIKHDMTWLPVTWLSGVSKGQQATGNFCIPKHVAAGNRLQVYSGSGSSKSFAGKRNNTGQRLGNL